MELIKPTFHIWLIYNTLKMLCDQHHITISEVDQAIEIFKLNNNNEYLVLQPYFDSMMVRAGTPVCNI